MTNKPFIKLFIKYQILSTRFDFIHILIPEINETLLTRSQTPRKFDCKFPAPSEHRLDVVKKPLLTLFEFNVVEQNFSLLFVSDRLLRDELA